jgi:hypothetical protein
LLVHPSRIWSDLEKSRFQRRPKGVIFLFPRAALVKISLLPLLVFIPPMKIHSVPDLYSSSSSRARLDSGLGFLRQFLQASYSFGADRILRGFGSASSFAGSLLSYISAEGVKILFSFASVGSPRVHFTAADQVLVFSLGFGRAGPCCLKICFLSAISGVGVLSLLQDLVQRPRSLIAVCRSCSRLGPCSPDRSKLPFFVWSSYLRLVGAL